MYIERSDSGTLYVEFRDNWTNDVRVIAPGVQVSYTPDGELAVLEILADAAERMELDEMQVAGIKAVVVYSAPVTEGFLTQLDDERKDGAGS